MDSATDFDPEKCPLCGKRFNSPEATYEDWTIFRVLPGERKGVRIHLVCSAKERAERYLRQHPR